MSVRLSGPQYGALTNGLSLLKSGNLHQDKGRDNTLNTRDAPCRKT